VDGPKTVALVTEADNLVLKAARLLAQRAGCDVTGCDETLELVAD
jgi:hypothetical protein